MPLSTEKKVGFFFIAGIVLLGVMLEMGEKWNPFVRNVAYKTYLSSTTGLKVGDPVRLAGVEVGAIKKIGLDGDKVRIEFARSAIAGYQGQELVVPEAGNN